MLTQPTMPGSLPQLHSVLLAMLCAGALAASCCCVGGLDNDAIAIHPPRHAPVAQIAATPDHGAPPLEVALDASASTDADGTIVKYDWDFDGDGTYDLLDGGATASHTYTAAGVYAPRVRVTDNDGLAAEAATTVTAAALVPPTAVGHATPEGEGSTVADLDARDSFDPDGTIVQYDWDFNNDGTFELIDGGATLSHDFGAFGTFTVHVRVTDSEGLTNTAAIEVILAELPNVPPVAQLTPTPAKGNAPLDVTWDASGSTDSDGTIVQYDWDMNDDGTFEIADGAASQSVTYLTNGTHLAAVRVTDDDGASDIAAGSVSVNIPPIANLVPDPPSGVAPLTATWDASNSLDVDGSIAQYDWDMDNDGTFEITDGGSSQTVTDLPIGEHTVGVRVTDNGGLADQTTANVTALATPVAALVAKPSYGFPPIYVTWDATGSTDADGQIVRYDWDMDNDGTFEITDGGASREVLYIDGGEIFVSVRVTDNDGLTAQATNSVYLLKTP